ncbi:MAG: iron-containing alcohol dehydrogenase [Planctomycetaceae bacterium]
MTSVPQSRTNSSVRSLNAFDFQPRTRVIFGAGTVAQLGPIAQESGKQRALLVTDPGLQEAGHSESAAKSLRNSGLQVAVFDDVSPNPTTDDVDRCVQFARKHDCDLIVGLGGGSSMDCAKGANFLLTNGGQMHDYRGVGKARLPMLPMIAVPTTAGTGSEAQSFAVIADAETHMKMPCGDPKAACRAAILDPELTLTMPRSVAAATGIDAMTHAIESYVTTKRNPVSQMFARQAWQLLSRAFPVTLREPQNLDARGEMLLGAHLAGAAIENSMLGAAHATANPLSAHFQTVHGVAVGIMLPHVIRWNAAEVDPLYRDLIESAGWMTADGAQSAAESLAEGFTDMLRLAGMPLSLKAALPHELTDQEIELLASEASQQWTNTFNPRRTDAEMYVRIYRNAL